VINGNGNLHPQPRYLYLQPAPLNLNLVKLGAVEEFVHILEARIRVRPSVGFCRMLREELATARRLLRDDDQPVLG